MPQRLQLKRTKGWRKPPGAVKVDRTTKYGNPFPVKVFGRKRSLELFRMFADPENSAVPKVQKELNAFRAAERELYGPGPATMTLGEMAAMELRGKDLLCWCNIGEACHADILLELANKDA